MRNRLSATETNYGDEVMNEYFLGVDFGGTNIGIGLLDSQGNIVGRGSLPAEVSLGPRSWVQRVTSCCRGVLKAARVSIDDVKGVGIGSPGPLSVKEGRIIKAGNLPGFDNFCIRSELSGALGIGGVLENDANAACWGEYWLGAAKDNSDMVMFTLGTGIGGGIISSGELVHGSDDNGGELGHIIVEANGRECSCGQKGCLEAYASASNTAARANELLSADCVSSLNDIYGKKGEVTCRDIFDHALQGDGFASEIIDVAARALAQACVSMRHIVEPERVVLAGGMIKAGEIIVERVRKFYDEMIWTLKPEPMDICLATLGDDASIVGAAGLAKHAYESGKLSPVGV